MVIRFKACDLTWSLCNVIFPLPMLTMGGPVRCWDLEDDVAIHSTHLRPQGALLLCLTKALGEGLPGHRYPLCCALLMWDCVRLGTTCVLYCWREEKCRSSMEI